MPDGHCRLVQADVSSSVVEQAAFYSGIAVVSCLVQSFQQCMHACMARLVHGPVWPAPQAVTMLFWHEACTVLWLLTKGLQQLQVLSSVNVLRASSRPQQFLLSSSPCTCARLLHAYPVAGPCTFCLRSTTCNAVGCAACRPAYVCLLHTSAC